MPSRFFAVLSTLLVWLFFDAVGISQTKPNTPGKKTAAPAKPLPVKLPAISLKAPTEPAMKVAPVDRTSRAAAIDAAGKIDAILEKSWKELRTKSQPSLREEQFLRRVYLELGGRIPTYDEASKFLTSRSKDKRPDLIDSLLESPDYVSHFYNYWANVFRLCERPQNNIVLDPYLAYVKEKIADGKVSNAFQQLVRANQYAVRVNKRELKLPHDYAYSDAKPDDIVKPKVLWGSVPSSASKADRREQFAAWVVSREDRQFARNIANRIWKKMMGLGIVEPVDDFKADNKPSNPELLEHLTDEVLRLNFDIRELVRIIANTQTYQKLAMVHDPSATEPYPFAAPVLHRMTAEQIWDSLLILVAYNPWAYQRPTAKEIAAVVDLDLAKVKLDDAEKSAANFESTFFLPKYNRDLQKLCGYKGQLLVRASEIPAPLPLGHFLRQFGQSDREGAFPSCDP